MEEIFEITEFVQEEAGQGTNLIWGNCFDEKLEEKIMDHYRRIDNATSKK